VHRKHPRHGRSRFESDAAEQFRHVEIRCRAQMQGTAVSNEAGIVSRRPLSGEIRVWRQSSWESSARESAGARSMRSQPFWLRARKRIRPGSRPSRSSAVGIWAVTGPASQGALSRWMRREAKTEWPWPPCLHYKAIQERLAVSLSHGNSWVVARGLIQGQVLLQKGVPQMSATVG
jgi:hypothetical protein